MFVQYALLSAALLPLIKAARPFLEEPDTGQASFYRNVTNVTSPLPDIEDIATLYDFEYLAQKHLNESSFTYYRNGAGGEWSYRNNLEVFPRLRFRPRVMMNVNNVGASLPSSILGFNFSAPFFISPAARAGYAHPDGEMSIARGAAAENILYIPSDLSSRSKEDIQSARAEGQIMFQQLYLDPSDGTEVLRQIREAEDFGFNALVLTVDSPADNNRPRAIRLGVGSADSAYTSLTWDQLSEYQSQTKLPIIPKGIQTWEDAVIGAQRGLPALFLSNHGGRTVDGSPSGLEVAIEIHKNAPWVFDATEIWADGGVRYGADVLKLLALGVKAVGLGRPFMYSNVYGEQGVAKAIQIMKREVAIDAANIGVADVHRINTTYIDIGGYPNSWNQRR